MKSTVAIVKNEDIYEATFKAIEKLEVDLKGKILIKPNLTLDVPIQRRACTNPEVIDALIDVIRNCGGEASVGESSMVGCDTLKAYERSGLKEICKKKNVKFIDFNGCEPVRVKIDGEFLKEVIVAKDIFDFDKIISVPVMKTHVLTGVTLGMKNMKGLQYRNEKIRLHEKGIKMLHLGIVKRMNLILASKDVVSADATACRVMGINPYEIYHIKRAEEVGIGKIKNVEIEGEKIKNIMEKFKNPLRANKMKYKFFDVGMSFVARLKGTSEEENAYRVVMELMKTKPIIENCKKCVKCAEICPQGAIEDFRINRIKCISCMICMEACPFGAIKAEEISVLRAGKEFGKCILRIVLKKLDL